MKRSVIIRAAPALLLALACGIAERQVHERTDTAGASSGGVNSAGAGFVTFGGTFSTPMGGVGTGPQPLGGMGPFPPGGMPPLPAGGMATMPVGGKPPIADCPMVPPVEPSCEVAPSAAGQGGVESSWCEPTGQLPGMTDTGAGGESAGAGGESAGAGGESATSGRLLIDDFEDGDDASFDVLSGRGGWFVVNDGSGQQYPMPCTLPSLLEEPARGGQRAMHTFGRGFMSVGGGYSLLGLSLRSGAPACDLSIDASAFEGVEFWARGSGVVRFFIATVATNPLADAGTCPGLCYDSHGLSIAVGSEWQRFRLPFSALVQEGWGYAADFDRAQILALEWSAKVAANNPTPAACFDFWIDDVALYSQ